MTDPLARRTTFEATSLNWQAAAACAGTDEGLWHQPDRSADRTRERRAKAICRRCTVATDCLEWAFATDDQYAVLGGTNPDERNRMRPKASK